MRIKMMSQIMATNQHRRRGVQQTVTDPRSFWLLSRCRLLVRVRNPISFPPTDTHSAPSVPQRFPVHHCSMTCQKVRELSRLAISLETEKPNNDQFRPTLTLKVGPSPP